MILKNDYTDRIASGSKKYELVNNGDGTYCIEDRTIYATEGDYYGASDLNKQNFAYNTLVEDYAHVDDMIAYLESIGVTVADNSLSSILAAINSIATNSFNSGRTNGRRQVIDNPNQYNLYSNEQYQDISDTVSDYQDCIQYVTISLTSLKNTVIPNYNNEMTRSKEYVKDIIDGAVANMSAAQAKNSRASIKTAFDNEGNVCKSILNSVCGAIDDCLRKMSI